MRAQRVLVDTPVWVEYFRGGNPILSARLDEFIKIGQVCIPAVVLAELVQGAKSEEEINTIEDLKEAFTIVDQKEGAWLEAGKISFNLRRKGRSVHLTDCYIAAIARQNACAILTLDTHFRDICAVLDVELLQ